MYLSIKHLQFMYTKHTRKLVYNINSIM